MRKLFLASLLLGTACEFEIDVKETSGESAEELLEEGLEDEDGWGEEGEDEYDENLEEDESEGEDGEDFEDEDGEEEHEDEGAYDDGTEEAYEACEILLEECLAEGGDEDSCDEKLFECLDAIESGESSEESEEGGDEQ